ncbi:MAG: hypothetical protein ACI9OJ_004502 [Myxococcota bacterium]|jgi:hypothetical protein
MPERAAALCAGTVKLGGKSPALALLQRGRKLTAQKTSKARLRRLGKPWKSRY